MRTQITSKTFINLNEAKNIVKTLKGVNARELKDKIDAAQEVAEAGFNCYKSFVEDAEVFAVRRADYLMMGGLSGAKYLEIARKLRQALQV